MFSDMKINIDIPKIQPVYIVFKRGIETYIKNPITYSKTITVIEEHNIQHILLRNTDIILDIKNGREFKVNEKILMVQRYIHNELNIPYKDVIDVEIIYTEKKLDNIELRLTHRYPNEGRSSIDFQATILDTFVECEIKRENVINNDRKMYIMVMTSSCPNERKSIGELVNRYLFNESVDSQRNQIDQQTIYRSSSSNHIFNTFSSSNLNMSVEHPYNWSSMENNSNYCIFTPSYPIYSPVISQDIRNINNLENNISAITDYELKIQELEIQRENELNEIRNTFSNSREMLEEGYEDEFYIINNELHISPLNLLGNMVNLLLYVNNISENNDIDFENLMEPVRVTVSEISINTFLTSFKYGNIENDEKIKIKDQDKCTICLYTYEKDEDVSYLNTCDHLFHTICITKWLLEFNHKCPICRKSSDPLKNDNAL